MQKESLEEHPDSDLRVRVVWFSMLAGDSRSGWDECVMKAEVLYFDGCPTYEAATNTLRAVLAEEGVEAKVTLIAVNSDEEARRLRFPGSPTLRVDGRDLFPAPERDEWGLGCRVYATPEGLRGSPTAEMFRDALTTRGGAGADRHL